MSDTVVIGLFFALFGAVFAGIGLYLISKTRAFITESQKVSAEVLSVSETHDRDDDGRIRVTYCPTVRFQTLDGVEHTATTYYSSSSYNYPVGTMLSVLYKPGEETVRIPGGFNQYFLPGMFAGSGGVLVLVGLSVAIFA
ncbi:MAG: DUF3592 domain-containing protein [Pseudomonadota bacterium]